MTDNAPTLAGQIKQGPHWRVLVRPIPYAASQLAMSNLAGALQRTTVRIRGWDFPHVDRQIPLERGVDFVGSSSSFMGHLEYWRFYQSAQLVYLSSLRETTEPDWDRKLRQGAAHRIVVPADFDWSGVPGFIEMRNFIYTVTEVFEFAARLGLDLGHPEAMSVTIALNNIRGFVLAVDDVRRGWWEYCFAQVDSLEHVWVTKVADLAGDSSAASLRAITWFFERMGWDHPNVEAIRQDQAEVLFRSKP